MQTAFPVKSGKIPTKYDLLAINTAQLSPKLKISNTNSNLSPDGVNF